MRAQPKNFVILRVSKDLAVRRIKVLNATFPFPQVFGLRRLRSNPPCSLWLQSVHWTNCFTRRAHITVPPCKGTHGDRVAGDNTRSRHNQRHFSYYATSLCAPATQQNATHSRTTHTRAPARQKQANLSMSKKDESAVFGVWEKEHKDQKANDYNGL